MSQNSSKSINPLRSLSISESTACTVPSSSGCPETLSRAFRISFWLRVSLPSTSYLLNTLLKFSRVIRLLRLAHAATNSPKLIPPVPLMSYDRSNTSTCPCECTEISLPISSTNALISSTDTSPSPYVPASLNCALKSAKISPASPAPSPSSASLARSNNATCRSRFISLNCRIFSLNTSTPSIGSPLASSNHGSHSISPASGRRFTSGSSILRTAFLAASETPRHGTASKETRPALMARKISRSVRPVKG
mmetsp:Transcript_16978/g.45514  ORF Transcript_16978/g.45514 Transcript_16978/m.45514 type:complete len:251 (-) Transcript_16978:766-1518(-)